MRHLDSLDTQFVVAEDGRNHAHIVAASVYDPSTTAGGRLTVDDVRALVADRLHLLPVFRWRLVPVPFGIDYPYWAQDIDFDPHFHIREAALPPPGDIRQFADLVERIASLPLDRSRPLWELYVVQGLENGYVGLITKMHHAAVDGIAGTEVMTVLLDHSPDAERVPAPTDPVGAGTVPTEWQMFMRGLAGVPMQPLRVLKSLPRSLRHLDDAAMMRTIPGVRALAGLSRALFPPRRDGGLLERPKIRAPRIVTNGRISGHRRAAFGSLSLDTVKAIKNALGFTVNDVVVAVCSGGLRRWLEDRGELPDESLVGLIPVSVRTAEEQGTFGNRISMMCVPIATDEPDPQARAVQVHETLRSTKERHRALPATLLQDANNFLPPALFARAARATGALLTQPGIEPPANLLISNVPGSPIPLYCAGARQVATYPASAIFDGVGLNITVLSYQDSIDIGIVVDRDQIDDPWLLLHAIQDSLEELAQSVGVAQALAADSADE